MTLSRQKRRLKWLSANLCRFLLSFTFLFSGVVKLIDPRGTQYKIEDYALALGVDTLLPMGVGLALAVGLAMFECYVGFNLFFGIRRRTTTRLALLLMLFMTPLTLWLLYTSSVPDCGCFGDALRLTPWQSFTKNAILLFASLVATFHYRRLTRFITERNQWLLSLYALVFALAVATYSIRHLPLIDFRPYRVGTDLPKSMLAEWENAEQGEMKYADFAIQTMQGEDITLSWLQADGYKFLLVAPYLEEADDGSMDRINALYDYCRVQHYPFIGLTASLDESISRWKDLTGAEYDFALTDGTVLKTMIRANPGVMLLHDGIVYQKWAATDFPLLSEDAPSLEQLSIGQMQYRSRVRTMNRLFAWFLLPLLLCTLVDRIWVGRKFYRRNKIHEVITNGLKNIKN